MDKISFQDSRLMLGFEKSDFLDTETVYTRTLQSMFIGIGKLIFVIEHEA